MLLELTIQTCRRAMQSERKFFKISKHIQKKNLPSFALFLFNSVYIKSILPDQEQKQMLARTQGSSVCMVAIQEMNFPCK